MSCTVCNHPQRQAIDLALLNRTATLAGLSEKHQLSQSALHRHKQHLVKKMAETQNRFQDLLRESYLFILNKFLTMVWGIAQESEAEGNSRQLLQAVRQGTAIMKFMAKLDGSLMGDTVHRLLAFPQWAAAGSLLPTDPQFVADCRQALADSLFTSCPEPDSRQGDDAALDDIAHLNPEMLQNLLTGLSQSLGSTGCTPPPPQRQKSGKKPKKAPGSSHNHKQNQKHSRCEKNTGKDPRPPVGCLRKPETAPPNPFSGTGNSKRETPAWVRALDEGRLDINTLHAIGAGRPINLDLSGVFTPA